MLHPPFPGPDPPPQDCLLLLDHNAVACFLKGTEFSLLPILPLLNARSESLSALAKQLGRRVQIMSVFFPRHPPPTLNSKSIYLPHKVLIDRRLECSASANWWQASPNRAAMPPLLSAAQPDAEPPRVSASISKISSGTPPSPTTKCFFGSLIFQRENVWGGGMK